jgi:hypothetical protein
MPRLPPSLLALVAAAAGAAVLASGCGASVSDAPALTCGQLRHDPSGYRTQARSMVAGDRLAGRSLSRERSLLDAELAIRNTCRGAPDDHRPYAAARDELAKRPAFDSVAAGG